MPTITRADTLVENDLISLFKVLVVKKSAKRAKLVTEWLADGFVTDFVPTHADLAALKIAFKPLPLTTLFSIEERRNADPYQLLMKQFLHYVEVYGLDSPGLFDLEVRDGNVVVVGFVRGVTETELGDLIRAAIYAKKPLADVDALKRIIDAYGVTYDINLVGNNEMRVLLYRAGDKFTNGDDAVRFIVHATTESTLVIKSERAVAEIAANRAKVKTLFLEQHEIPLAQVFNRHQRIIIALKRPQNRTVINKIARLSKTHHVPLREAVNKTFIARSLAGTLDGKSNVLSVLGKIALRDKFKYLNLIEWKLLRKSMDAFVIRNGRVHIAKDRPVYSVGELIALRDQVIAALTRDLKPLRKQKILLDASVEYGLPISQKQMLGNLPFGTLIKPDGDILSAGIYWEDAWGARDLDLSAVDKDGNRTGWGGFSGYNRDNPVTFSGDVTSAPNGAMEFLTSSTSYRSVYGLYVNIFAGEPGAECELVIGTESKGKWIMNPKIREKTKLRSRGNIFGFVRDGKFVVYYCRMSNGRANFGDERGKILVQKGLAPMWTVNQLLEEVGVKFDVDKRAKTTYDHDLSYAGFSVNKLEAMFAGLAG